VLRIKVVCVSKVRFQRKENSPHCSAQLLVVHVVVFPLVTPQFGDLFTADKAEDAVVVVLPTDETRAVLGFLEQVTDKLPQLAMTLFCRKMKKLVSLIFLNIQAI
jgi:hypothetical protein